MRGMANPVAIAIAHKADLGLSDDVAAKLQAIAKDLEEKNAPLVKQRQEAMQGVTDFQSMSDEQRQAFFEKVRPLGQKARENSQAARAEAEKLLTADQVQKLAAFIQQEMPQRGPRN